LVSIKVINCNDLSVDALQAVETEISVLKLCKHRHIVQMIDVIRDGTFIYIILEHCSEGNLSKFIDQHTKLPEKLCRLLMQQLSLAVQYLRFHNIAHLDLKPANLLLTKAPYLTLKVAGLYSLFNYIYLLNYFLYNCTNNLFYFISILYMI